MTAPASKRALFILAVSFFVAPILSIAGGQLWWGVSVIPLLPILVFFSFFLLTGWQYGLVVFIGSFWFDVVLGYPLALSVIASACLMFTLRIFISVLANRSFLSDSIIVLGLYGVWFTVVYVIERIALRITPTAHQLIEHNSFVFIGLVAALFLLVLLRRPLAALPSIPKSLS